MSLKLEGRVSGAHRAWVIKSPVLQVSRVTLHGSWEMAAETSLLLPLLSLSSGSICFVSGTAASPVKARYFFSSMFPEYKTKIVDLMMVMIIIVIS